MRTGERFVPALGAFAELLGPPKAASAEKATKVLGWQPGSAAETVTASWRYGNVPPTRRRHAKRMSSQITGMNARRSPSWYMIEWTRRHRSEPGSPPCDPIAATDPRRVAGLRGVLECDAQALLAAADLR